jgi:hypothetical protein
MDGQLVNVAFKEGQYVRAGDPWRKSIRARTKFSSNKPKAN